MFSLRKFQGKQLGAYLRKGDFAHPGETESIDLVMQAIKKHKNHPILDVGCGLGGTADYLNQKNYGQIYGSDIEASSIEYAKQTYPGIDFRCTDVINTAPTFHPLQFNTFVLFNSFYAFTDQLAALQSLRDCAKEKATLLIFDYSLKDNQTEYQWISNSSFIPVILSTIEEMLLQTGWRLLEKQNITDKYLMWYEDFHQKLLKNSKEVISIFNQDSFDESVRIYSKMVQELSSQKLGGVIIQAEAM